MQKLKRTELVNTQESNRTEKQNQWFFLISENDAWLDISYVFVDLLVTVASTDKLHLCVVYRRSR